MELTVLIIAIFLVGTALLLGLLYLLIAAPTADKALRSRLEAIQNAAYAGSSDEETELLRRDVLSTMPVLQRILMQIPAAIDLNLLLQQAGMTMNFGRLLAVAFIIAVSVLVIGLVLGLPALLVLILVVTGGSIPFLVIAFKRYKRFSKFEEQFPDAIDLLARAVRAGHAFTTGLELIGSEMPEPVAMEFRRTYEQQNLGLPLKEALQNLLVRVPRPDVHVFVTALIIQRESGGNLAEILDNLSRVIRERFKLYRQVKVFTAQGRMSLYVLTGMPFVVGLGLFLLNREYISRLFIDPLGQKMLVVMFVLLILGYFVINRIIQPKI